MKKILVAEDSLIVNRHISQVLSTSNYEVMSVYSGKEAVKNAGSFHPDIIMMDIMMETDSDGIDAAIEIRKRYRIPVIFLTALTDEPTIQRAKAGLPYGYVVKPFNEAELLSNVAIAIHKSETEKLLFENTHIFQTIVEQIEKAIVLLDSEDKVVYCNKLVEKIFDKSFESLIHHKIQEIVTFYDQEKEVDLGEFLNSDIHLKEYTTEPHADQVFGNFKFQEVFVNQEKHRLLVFSDVTERVQIQKEREETKQKQLSMLIEGQEKERTRIARDLHDGVGQVANIIKLTAKKENASSELVELIDHFVKEVREVAHGLHPSSLTDFPIEICLSRMIKELDEKSIISFDLSCQDIPQSLPMNIKVNIYRIAQECISNILKHSKASQATIQLYGMDDAISLTIEDDGVGFDTNRLDDGKEHHGMQNIMFRVDMMGADFTVDSQPNMGTFMNITIPYKTVASSSELEVLSEN